MPTASAGAPSENPCSTVADDARFGTLQLPDPSIVAPSKFT